MSTRCFIGRENSDGSVDAIYCHSDGYIENGVGECLFKNYTDKDKVDALISLGDLSTLGREPKSSPEAWKKRSEPGFDFDAQCLAYKDNGDTNTSAISYDTKQDIIDEKDEVIEYVYIYDVDTGKWTVFDGETEKELSSFFDKDNKNIKIEEGKNKMAKKVLKESYDFDVNEIAKFIEDSVDTLLNGGPTLCWHDLDNNLMVAVGWTRGWDDNGIKRDDCIQDPNDLDWAIDCGVFIEENNETDLEYLRMPYYKNGEVIDTTCSVHPDDYKDGFTHLAEYMLEVYDNIKDLEIDDDGMIIEESCKTSQKDVKETYSYIYDKDKEIYAYCLYDNAVKKAQELGLKEAEYGDVYNSKVSYCYWNKSGDRNEDEEVMCYYMFDKNGKPKKSYTQEELDAIIHAYDEFGVSEDQIDDIDEIHIEESCKKSHKKSIKESQEEIVRTVEIPCAGGFSFDEFGLEYYEDVIKIVSTRNEGNIEYVVFEGKKEDLEDFIDECFLADEGQGYGDFDFFNESKQLKESLVRYADTDEQEETLAFIDRLAKKAGVSLYFGTKVGRFPQRIVLDHRYQDGECSVCSNGSFEIGEYEFGSYDDDYFDLSEIDEDEVIKALKSLDENTEESLGESKSLKEAPLYDLKPRYDSRQSFYNKATVDTGDKGDKNKLYSYNTLVAEIKDGKPIVYGTYSPTTLRHIKEFLLQNGFKAESKSQIERDYMGKPVKESNNLKEAKSGLYLDVDAYKDETTQHLKDFADAYKKVVDDFAVGVECDDGIPCDANEFIGTKKAMDLFDNSFAEKSFDELRISDWCDEVIDNIKKWTPGTPLKEVYEPADTFKTFKFIDKTEQGFDVVKVFQDTDDNRLHIIAKRPKGDFVVGLGYNPDKGYWNQGRYDFTSQESAEKYFKKNGYNVKPYSAKRKEVDESKQLTETFKGEDIIDDLVDRARSIMKDGNNAEKATEQAIDDGLIYSEDIIDLAQHYGVIDDRELEDKFYSALYDDIYKELVGETGETDDVEHDEDYERSWGPQDDDVDESVKSKKKSMVSEAKKHLIKKAIMESKKRVAKKNSAKK